MTPKGLQATVASISLHSTPTQFSASFPVFVKLPDRKLSCSTV
jgi:hypothetical protein